MYDMGIWGVAWLVYQNKTYNGFINDFYPNVAYIGYEQSFINAIGLSLNDFYNQFAEWFDKTTESEKLSIII